MKKGHGYYFFLMSIVLLAVVTLTISYFDSQGTMLAPRPTYSQCITPPVYPQLIMQSGTICPGTYNYGIGIGANNVKINCQAGTSFNGANWGGTNGATILSVNNITLDGCAFTNFTQDGVHIEGTPSSQSSEINLLNIVSSINRKNGIYVGPNVLNFSVNNSLLLANERDGIHFNANNILNPSDIFPNGINIAGSKIIHNLENGINIYAFDYYVAPSGVPYSVLPNNSIVIEKNNISSNLKDGIQSLGFAESSRSKNFGVHANYINDNGEDGISMVSDRTTSYGQFFTSIGYISFNDLISNGRNGISFDVPERINLTWVNTGATIYANYIAHNGKNGIFYDAESYNITTYLNDFNFYSDIVQNSIIYNNEDGIYLAGSDTFTHNSIRPQISCNDILYSGAGNGDGIEIRDLTSAQFVNIKDRNIIENNNRGIYIDEYDPEFTSSIGYSLYNNSITSNNVGLLVNHSYDSDESSSYYGNDFDQNTVQAIDRNSWAYPGFRNNWWSDYSPTCADANPADGWCDVPRFIPVGETEWQTKAGTWWGHKLRGYLVKANTGIVPKQDCPIIELPQPFNNTLVGTQTNPFGTNTGEPGSGGSGSSGTTGGTGEPGSSNSDG